MCTVALVNTLKIKQFDDMLLTHCSYDVLCSPSLLEELSQAHEPVAQELSAEAGTKVYMHTQWTYYYLYRYYIMQIYLPHPPELCAEKIELRANKG